MSGRVGVLAAPLRLAARLPRPAGALPWARPRHELLLLALVAIAALSPLQAPNPQDESRVCLAEALLHGHVANDRCLAGVADYARYGGHLYSDKAPGLALLELPSVAALEPGAAIAHWPRRDFTLWGVRVLSVGLAFCLLAFLVGRVGEGLAPGYGGLVLVSFALGTLVDPLASVSFEHVPAGLAAFAAFLLAWRRRPLLAGLVAGAALLVEYETGLALAVVGLYLARAGLRPLLAYLAGLIPGVVGLGAYDAAAFGSPFHLSYRYVANEFAGEQATGFFGIGVPHLAGAFDVLAGDGGLLVTSPVLLLAAVGLVRLGRRYPAEALAAAAITVLVVLANCGYFLPYGGVSPGPRFAASALPFLALGLGPAFAWRPRTTVALAGLSVLTTTALALVWPSATSMRQTVWGELARLLVEPGASHFPTSIVPNAVSALGLGPQGGAVLVGLAALGAFTLALAAALRCLPRRPPLRRPAARAALLGLAATSLLVGADASAIAAYPYGDGYRPQVSAVSTAIGTSAAVASVGQEVNFVVTTTNAAEGIAGDLELTIRLGPGMRLVGPPAYTRGSGCGGTQTIVCNLDYLQALQSTPVRFGVELTAPGEQTIHASASSGGIPGWKGSSSTVIVSS